MNIKVYKNGDVFDVLMYDDDFWEGSGYAIRFDCSADELQVGIKKGLALYESR